MSRQEVFFTGANHSQAAGPQARNHREQQHDEENGAEQWYVEDWIVAAVFPLGLKFPILSDSSLEGVHFTKVEHLFEHCVETFRVHTAQLQNGHHESICVVRGVKPEKHSEHDYLQSVDHSPQEFEHASEDDAESEVSRKETL